jgi:predicted TIM-barrel fold metal-dependent hydrolase
MKLDFPVVDAHVHVFLADMPHIPNARHNIQYDFSKEQLLQALDQHGVQYACIAAASPYGDYNDYTLRSTRGEPRLRGTVILEPTVEKYVLEAMDRDGIVGVRLPYISLKTLPDLTSFEYQRTLRRIRDLGWHVHLHLDGPRIPQVLPVLEKSGVKLVIDHFARPEPEGVNSAGFKAALKAMENGRTWMKVSAAYRIGEERAAECGRELLKQCGPDRLLWASDCPFVGFESKVKYQQTIDAVLAWLPESARRKVFGENALKLYFGG